MEQLKNKDAFIYQEQFNNRCQYIKNELTRLNDFQVLSYIEELHQYFVQIIQNISAENFWHSLPYILGIDSRLSIVEEILSLQNEIKIYGTELINLVESDYKMFNHEKMGLKLNEKKEKSLIFCVE
ncbi:hypothetical protein MYF49_001990 [Enterococcus faecium]|nr:hypothetical protein [Enterococcus faecium]EME8124382.1 hypothetical protein [Enterococcus faecium]